jgi:hypothetical protein
MAPRSAKSPPAHRETQSAGFGSMRQVRDEIDRMQDDPTYTPPTP